MVLASVREDDDGLICKVALLEGLEKVHQAWEVAEEKFHSLSNASADGTRRLVISEMEHWEQFEELSLLWAWGAKLCFIIIAPTQVRIPLSARLRATALCHTKMVGDLTPFRAVVSSTVELVLGRLLGETSRVEVVNELVTKFQRLEELCSRLKGPSMRIYALLIGLLASQSRWANHLDEAVRRLEAKIAERH
jgi:hypothetical protein